MYFSLILKPNLLFFLWRGRTESRQKVSEGAPAQDVSPGRKFTGLECVSITFQAAFFQCKQNSQRKEENVSKASICESHSSVQNPRRVLVQTLFRFTCWTNQKSELQSANLCWCMGLVRRSSGQLRRNGCRQRLNYNSCLVPTSSPIQRLNGIKVKGKDVLHHSYTCLCKYEYEHRFGSILLRSHSPSLDWLKSTDLSPSDEPLPAALWCRSMRSDWSTGPSLDPDCFERTMRAAVNFTQAAFLLGEDDSTLWLSTPQTTRDPGLRLKEAPEAHSLINKRREQTLSTSNLTCEFTIFIKYSSCGCPRLHRLYRMHD